MSWLDRIHEANRHDLGRHRRLVVAGTAVGWVGPETAGLLGDWPEVFDVEAGRVRLAGTLDQPRTSAATRSEAVAGVLAALRAAGLLDGWRDELYPVAAHPLDPPLLLMERAALPLFGVTGCGVHVNGVVRDPAGGPPRMWVARRSLHKPTHPGELDQMGAGGQPVGLGVMENVVKECAEEAGIPASLATRARPVGAIRYCCATAHGLRPDVVYNFDLELPEHFRPVNHDGEVQAFELWELERVMQVVRETAEFKFNCSLVIIDWLIRQGFIGPEDRQYLELLRGLQGLLDVR